MKLSPDEQKKRLLIDLFGNDFRPDEKFNKAIDQAIEDIRQRRIQQSQAQTAGKHAICTEETKRLYFFSAFFVGIKRARERAICSADCFISTT